MAIIKSLPATKTLENQLMYLEQEEKNSEHLRIGINCTKDNIIKEFNIIKALYNKPMGKGYYHFVQSFSPEDIITPEKALVLGREWIESCIKGHQIYIVTHTDKNHIHNHFLINSVSFKNGLKLQISPQRLMEMKRISNDICKRENLAVINLDVNSGISKCHKEYNLEKRNNKNGKGILSWKEDMRKKINYVTNISSDYNEFKNLLSDNYDINIREKGEALIYINKSIKKEVKDKRLGGYFTKVAIENRFIK